jgi:hydroxymethylglutaryl-CoA reductase
MDSRISNFYCMSVDERINVLVERGFVDAQTARLLRNSRGMLSSETADRMVENVIGVYGLPLAVAPNFQVNGRDYVVPMVVEEPSVVAAVSAAAKLVRDSGGFDATSTPPISIGQIHLDGLADPEAATARLQAAESNLIELANRLQPGLAARGGGAVGIEIRSVQLAGGRRILALHLLVDTRDAMGANIVNTMCEGIAARVEELSGAKAVLKILSNLADHSMVTARATIATTVFGKNGSAVRDAIVLANDIANADPYRAATHNKGIMNGMDAVAIATGNDWRALEAGAHAYAASDGKYRALTRWTVGESGDLCGELTLPVRAGTVGGSLRSNPAAIAGLCIAGVESSQELGRLMAAVGLAQNLAALRALVSDGIQKGHMRLHARSVAVSAAVPRRFFERVVHAMIECGEVKEWKARQLVADLESPQNTAGGNARGRGKAAGKIILLGEHAVVYGQPAVALPLPDAITASLYDAESGVHLSIPAWDVEHTVAHGEQVGEGAMALLQFVLQRLQLESNSISVEVDARIPPAAGLGSSAALAVAFIRALDDAFALNMSDQAINALAFECETVVHGTPSGIDNTLAVFGKAILYRKEGPERILELVLDASPPLLIVSSGIRGITREQVKGVRIRRQQDEAAYERVFAEIGNLSLAGTEALTRGDYKRLGSLMNIGHGLLNALQVSTPLLEEMVDIARASGAAGAKMTGAGGGGCIVALCPGTIGAVSDAMTASGFEVIGDFFAAGNVDGRK